MTESRNSENSSYSHLHNYREQSRNSMMLITDVISSINEASKYSSLLPKTQEPSNTKIIQSLYNPGLWGMLTLISIISSALAIGIDFVCISLIQARSSFVKDLNTSLQVLVWLSYSLVFAFIAASCGKFISLDAEGSGIPEMKAIIGGAKVKKYLSYRTLSSKIVGLIAATASGLSVGREGPFIHIACILADKVYKIQFFKQYKRDAIGRRQLLASAVAVGVGVTFGSPIGGVLFSIEVTATYYNVSNLWKSLYSATVCFLFFKVFGIDDITNLITSRHYADAVIGLQLIPFIVQGLVFGVIGSSLVYCTGRLVHLKKTYKDLLIFNRYIYTFLISTVCSLTIYLFWIFQQGDKLLIKYMFQPEIVTDNLGDNARPNLMLYCVFKLLMTVISLSCPIPCGVFTPVFALGAVLGRLYGECLHSITGIHPGVYSLVGAASLASSVTHTISVIVIVFELSGQINYLPFMLVGVLSSCGISTLISSSIYDLIISLKKIPYMGTIRNTDLYKKTAKDIKANVHYLNNVSSLADIWNGVCNNVKNCHSVPIIDKSSFILGETHLKSLLNLLKSEYKTNKDKHKMAINLDDYIEMIYAIYYDEDDEIDLENAYLALKDVTDTIYIANPNKFWEEKVIISEKLALNLSPFIITGDTHMSKVHYFFVALALEQIYVTQRGELTGVITRELFLDSS
jgi:chloride channel 2